MLEQILDKSHYCSEVEYESTKDILLKELNSHIGEQVILKTNLVQLSVNILIGMMSNPDIIKNKTPDMLCKSAKIHAEALLNLFNKDQFLDRPR
jgi:hypothetical protein